MQFNFIEIVDVMSSLPRLQHPLTSHGGPLLESNELPTYPALAVLPWPWLAVAGAHTGGGAHWRLGACQSAADPFDASAPPAGSPVPR